MSTTRISINENMIVLSGGWYSIWAMVEEITPDDDLITPERLAKGDLEVAKNLKGKINRAVPIQLTIIKELVRRRVFPYHYEIYGVGFLELRNAFRAPWGVRSAAVLLEQWGVGISNSKADSIYQEVCRKIGQERIHVIEFVVEEMNNREEVCKHQDYKKSFELLVAAMDEERERLVRELNNY